MYNKKLVFSAASLGLLFFGISLLSLGTINIFLTSKFGLDEITVGSLAALLPFGILIASLAFGPLVDKYGYKILFIISSILILIGFECIAFTNTFFLIQISFFLIGLGGGVLNGGTNALVSDISFDNRQSELSLLSVFFGIGSLGMPAVTGFLSKYYSYENIISGIGFTILFLIVFIFVINFPKPKHPQGFPIKKILELTKDPALIIMGFFLFFESGIEGISNNWTAKFLQKGIQASPENALFALTFLAVGLTMTRLILTIILKVVPSSLVLGVSLIIAIIGDIILMSASSLPMAIVALVLLGRYYIMRLKISQNSIFQRHIGNSGI